jgi:hypothetical protein
MSYNVTWMANATDLYQTANSINSVTGDYFMSLMLLIIGLFVFYGTIQNGASTSLITTGLVTGIVGVLLWFINLVPFYIVVIPLTLMLIAVGIKWFE